MDGQILTLEEVSRYLKVNKATIYRMAQTGKIPALKVGKVWRFQRTRLEAWLISQQRGLENGSSSNLAVEASSIQIGR